MYVESHNDTLEKKKVFWFEESCGYRQTNFESKKFPQHAALKAN